MFKARSKVFLSLDSKLTEHALCEPGIFKGSSALDVDDSFVISRNKTNSVVSRFGDDVWDLTPYNLSPITKGRIYFNRVKKSGDKHYDDLLMKEVKASIFSLIYFVKNGRVGSLSISTITKYASIAFNLANFALDMRNKPLVGKLSLSELISNETYILHLAKQQSSRLNQSTHSFLNHLNKCGENKVGFKVNVVHEIHKPIPHDQHPLIPSRIYINYIRKTNELLDFYENNISKITRFVTLFEDKFFGMHKKSQRKLGVNKSEIRPSFDDAVTKYEMREVFEFTDVKPISRVSICSLLTQIQYQMSICIYLYTGMRNSEVKRLPFDCIKKHSFNDTIRDEDGKLIYPESSVNILSTTTKFSGYAEESTWLAPPPVIKAVSILQAITQVIAKISNVDSEQCPLFSNTLNIKLRNPVEVTFSNPKRERLNRVFNDEMFYITESDLEVLRASDENRNFDIDPIFSVGSPWPVSAHQFRRSLAFYAVNSGFVSLATVQKQFKHLSQEMSKYYSRNFENVKTIFGHYDTEQQCYVLPSKHIAFDIQVGMSLDTAQNLINDLLDNSTLYGKTGGYLEKQKERLKSGEIHIEELKESTYQSVERGEISYRKTLLGGCTNNDVCECSILGEFADCLTSKCAVIKESNIDSLIERTKDELSKYDVNSIEYLSTQSELDDLLNYKLNKKARAA